MSAIGSLSRAQANVAFVQQQEKVLVLIDKVNKAQKAVQQHEAWSNQWHKFNVIEKVNWLNAHGHEVKAGYDTRITRTDMPLPTRERELLEVVNKRNAVWEQELSLASSALRIESAQLEVFRLQAQK